MVPIYLWRETRELSFNLFVLHFCLFIYLCHKTCAFTSVNKMDSAADFVINKVLLLCYIDHIPTVKVFTEYFDIADYVWQDSFYILHIYRTCRNFYRLFTVWRYEVLTSSLYNVLKLSLKFRRLLHNMRVIHLSLLTS